MLPWQPLAKTVFYALIATVAVAPLVLGSSSVAGGYARLLGSRPMVTAGLAVAQVQYRISLSVRGGYTVERPPSTVVPANCSID
ncbi:hypothetical protein BH09ACT8_BH09ACT8_22000 [soil metagenome]